MRLLKAYTSGSTKTLRTPAMVFLIYVLNILLALIIAIPFFSILKNGIGNSDALNYLKDNFEFSSLREFTSQNKTVITTLLTQIFWIAVFYWLLSIFVTGGVLRTFTKNFFTMTSFFTGCGRNFFRIAAMSLFMIIVQIIIAVIVYLPLYMISDNLLSYSESVIYRIFIVTLSVHIILFFTVLIISDYAKFYLFLNDSYNIFKAFINSVRYVFSHFFKVYGLYVLLLVLPVFTLYIYTKIRSDIQTETFVGILILFAIQQIVIILRISYRIWILASQFEMYSDDFLRHEKIRLNKEAMLEADIKAKFLARKMSEKTQAHKEAEKIEEKNQNQVLTEEEVLQKIAKENPEEYAEIIKNANPQREWKEKLSEEIDSHDNEEE